MATTKVAQHNQKPWKHFSYACHIYGLNGHKMTDYPQFIETQKMFHGKSMTITKVQHVVEIQSVITDVNVLDVNVTTGSKTTKEHVFKGKEPRK